MDYIMTIPDAFALLVVTLWPIIPLWWIPVHGVNKLVKKLGFAMYPIIFVVWFFIAYLIYCNRVFLLEFRIDFPIIIRITGIPVCFCRHLPPVVDFESTHFRGYYGRS